MSSCQHDPFGSGGTIIVEAHPMMGVRLRCLECGRTADVSKKSGLIRPDRNIQSTKVCNCPPGRTTAHLPECPTQETSPAPLRMCISYQPHAKCIWHLDCTVGNDSGIMSVIAHEESRSLLECGHCKQRGYYPKGSVGSVCVDVVSAENRRA